MKKSGMLHRAAASGAATLLGVLAFAAPAGATASAATTRPAAIPEAPAHVSSSRPVNGPQTAGPEICGNGGTGYCLNDWNGAGSGGVVKMYYGGYTNDNFANNVLTGACDHGQVTNGGSGVGPPCPFPVGSGLNSEFNEDGIFELKSGVSGACIGTDIYAQANLGPCPSNSGGAGSNIFVYVYVGPNEGYFVNVYWSGQRGNSGPAYLDSGGNPGVQAFVSSDIGGASKTLWGIG